MTKPVLYTFPLSVWSAAPQLALAELDVDVDFKIIDLSEGANYDPEFLKLVSMDLVTFPSLIRPTSSEPQWHLTHPYPWRKFVHQHRHRD
jgi:hypothetical protein